MNKIIMNEYHAYGRRCGWNFNVIIDGKKVSKLFYGTNEINESKAIREFLRYHDRHNEAYDLENMVIETRYA